MTLPVDPDSPVPLYHQIAQAIRAALAAGTLQPGDALAPLRRAAEEWGVNVHTVRHAYTALARDGLLETHRGALGTRVATEPPRAATRPTSGRSLNAFLDHTLAEARARHGLTPEALADALLRSGAPGPLRPVYVVECSRWQAECHSAELRAEYRVDAVPWPLSDGEPPEGVVVATYFHYNDVRRLWPRRLSGVRFLSIHPDPALRDVLDRWATVWVCETDQDTADAVAADLSALVEGGRPAVRTRIASDANDLVPRRTGRGVPHLFSPRSWAALSSEARSHPNVHELRYVLDRDELSSLAIQEEWHPVSPLTKTSARP
jgi:GntR family transcriptional regulator